MASATRGHVCLDTKGVVLFCIWLLVISVTMPLHAQSDASTAAQLLGLLCAMMSWSHTHLLGCCYCVAVAAAWLLVAPLALGRSWAAARRACPQPGAGRTTCGHACWQQQRRAPRQQPAAAEGCTTDTAHSRNCLGGLTAKSVAVMWTSAGRFSGDGSAYADSSGPGVCQTAAAEGWYTACAVTCKYGCSGICAHTTNMRGRFAPLLDPGQLGLVGAEALLRT